MQQGLTQIIGTHDFTSFASRRSTKTSHVRTIFEAHMEVDRSMCRPSSSDQGVIHTYITGSGFLQHMVRIIMGTLIHVGKVKYLLIRLLKYWQHVIDHMLVQQLWPWG